MAVSCKRLLALLLVSAFLLPVHQVRGQGYSVEEIKPELQDPAWMQLNAALTDLSSYQADYVSIIKAGVVFGVAAYDAMSVYSKNLDGLVVGGDLRRPVEEHTTENKRTAMSFAVYRVLFLVYDDLATHVFQEMFANLKLQINDTSLDPTTAVGIGNIVGNAVAESRFNDYAKLVRPQDSRRRGRSAMDLRDYVPKNTPYQLKYKTRWQPQEFVLNDESYAQVYYGHELGLKPLLTGYHPSYFKVPRPAASLAPKSPAYKAQADRILAISAALNDTTKLMAEAVDGGLSGDGDHFLINKYNWGLEKQVMWNLVVTMNNRETIMVVNHWKTHFDNVRPFSVIRSSGLYENVTAWAGPGRGVATIRAVDFRQYNTRTDPSPEYPSGACTKYGGLEAVARRFVGTDEFGWSRTFYPGSSQVEPGVTPKEPVTFHFPTFQSLSDFAKAGREAGLVHFQAATEQGVLLGHAVGEAVHATLAAHFKTELLV